MKRIPVLLLVLAFALVHSEDQKKDPTEEKEDKGTKKNKEAPEGRSYLNPSLAPYGAYSYLAFQNKGHGYGPKQFGGHGPFGFSHKGSAQGHMYGQYGRGVGGGFSKGSSYGHHGKHPKKPGHLDYTKKKIDTHLDKLYKLGNRKLQVQVDYASTPLEYSYLQQYHNFPNPLAGTAFAHRNGGANGYGGNYGNGYGANYGRQERYAQSNGPAYTGSAQYGPQSTTQQMPYGPSQSGNGYQSGGQYQHGKVQSQAMYGNNQGAGSYGPADGYPQPPMGNYNQGQSGTYGVTSAYGQGSSAGYAQGSSAGYGQGSSAGYEQGSNAGYGQGSTAGYGQGSTAGYGQGSTAGYGQGSSAGYGQGSSAAYGQGSSAAYGQAQNLNQGQSAASYGQSAGGYGQGSNMNQGGQADGYGQSSVTYNQGQAATASSGYAQTSGPDASYQPLPPCPQHCTASYSAGPSTSVPYNAPTTQSAGAGPYNAPAPQPAPYSNPAPQPAPYNNPAPQPAPYNNPAPQPAPYNTPVPQPALYNTQPAPTNPFNYPQAPTPDYDNSFQFVQASDSVQQSLYNPNQDLAFQSANSFTFVQDKGYDSEGSFGGGSSGELDFSTQQDDEANYLVGPQTQPYSALNSGGGYGSSDNVKTGGGSGGSVTYVEEDKYKSSSASSNEYNTAGVSKRTPILIDTFYTPL